MSGQYVELDADSGEPIRLFTAKNYVDGSLKERPQSKGATLAKTISEYRGTKQAMQAIIDRHMQAAFAEIKQEFGDTPTTVYVNTVEKQDMGQPYPSGVYVGCEVRLGGE
jgi:hypothetical protein